MPYTITKHAGPVEKTHWWKDQNAKVPANVYWLEGHGLNRPATDVEVDLWQAGAGKCDRLYSCQRELNHEGSCNTTTSAQ